MVAPGDGSVVAVRGWPSSTVGCEGLTAPSAIRTADAALGGSCRSLRLYGAAASAPRPKPGARRAEKNSRKVAIVRASRRPARTSAELPARAVLLAEQAV